MEDILAYRNNNIGDSAWLVSEQKDEYAVYLKAVIEKFNRNLEDVERRCINFQENPEKLMSEISESIKEMLGFCESFEKSVGDKDIIKNARIKFRETTNRILSKSYCVNRTRTWPQGYQGDHKTLETIYKNMPLSDGIGYYIDLSLLNSTLAIAVRDRVKKLSEILRDEIAQRQRPSVLNIACGSCREIMDIVPEVKASGAKIICIDNDNDALSFAENRLSYTGMLSQIEFRKYNAIRMFDDGLNMTAFGKQDIIYSIGLFDYLPDDFLVRLFRALYNMLNPGGKLIAAFKDAEKYHSQMYHWIIDWDGFLQRTENDFDNLFHDAGIAGSILRKTRGETGAIIFYEVEK